MVIQPETEAKLLIKTDHFKNKLTSSVLKFNEDVSESFRQFLVFSLELEG